MCRKTTNEFRNPGKRCKKTCAASSSTRTRGEKKLPRRRRREALEAKCGRCFTPKASEQINTMASNIRYPRVHYFELARALSFVSGRGLPELVGAVVQFSSSI